MGPKSTPVAIGGKADMRRTQQNRRFGTFETCRRARKRSETLNLSAGGDKYVRGLLHTAFARASKLTSMSETNTPAIQFFVWVGTCPVARRLLCGPRTPSAMWKVRSPCWF